MQPFDDRSALGSGYDAVTPGRDRSAGPSDAPGFSAAEADRGELDLSGYAAEASDGGVGTVESAAPDGGYLVDTGPWILGRTVRVPAGAVGRVDHAARVVHVTLTRDQVKDLP